ncbi:hypothetical protein RM863_35285 [Streptomyces sp. DSM 41014]|uniref:DUF3168 domain-containing protein n=1 Tax=Streptomyces hintoniae TaxID=3075521 RepID=A0ABU2UWK0_9ACTN|nr:hypothetical protein [Streptomyces sp. DSM 41014]MDT0477399.1 hypothetical protein [Streptomyces sp. DSM 41014]
MNVTDRLIEALTAAGLAVGDGQPRTSEGPLTGRYVVVRPRQVMRGEGSIGAPNADRTPELQITSVGPSRRAADQVAELADQVALGPMPPPDGFEWQQAAIYVSGAATTTEPTTDPTAPEAPAWFRVDVYRYYLTPA